MAEQVHRLRHVAAVDACVFGGPNCTRLNRLNASIRTSKLMRDAVNVFATLMFSFSDQGLRTSGLVRGALPSSPTGAENAASFARSE